MRPPAFWSRPPGALAALLGPLGRIYAGATARRVARRGMRAAVPVICIGNISVGGTGKTPTVAALVLRLADRGAVPHVISKGYGGRLTETTRIDPARHDAVLAGDEPLLLSAFAPVWVGRDRAQSADAAVAAGATVLVLDDGFQDPALEKDLSVVVVDAERGFGNGQVLPAGPLREPTAVGLARADALLAIGSGDAAMRFREELPVTIDIPILRGRLATLATGMAWAGMRAFAFAGIGRPEKFFDTLRSEGAHIVGSRALDDHQPLSDALVSRLAREASDLGAQLVTTEKDAVRLPAQWRTRILTLPVRLEIEDWAPLDARLDALGL